MDPRRIELKTERLVVRLGSDADAEAAADFHRQNREHFRPWDPRRPESFFRAEWWRSRLPLDREAAAADRAYRLWIRPLDEPGRIIGHVHFSNVVRGAFHACHLGFGIDREFEGRSFMREALEATLVMAFDDLALHRIEANHRPENVRSGELLKRLRFVPQGYARDYLFIDGAWRDHVLTALTNQRWSPPSRSEG